MRVLQVGNFADWAPHSTENDLRRTLESMGHEVVTIHEQAWTGDPKALDCQPAFFLYTHTQCDGWGPPLKTALEFFAECRRRKIPTVSYHLDLWRGLSREAGMTSSPFFRADYCFTPDPATPEWWASKGVRRHVYSPPGVLEESCYLAEPSSDWSGHDVIFVGAKGYHHEYPFRGQLIDWLRDTYGRRFTLYEHASGMRGHKLNVLYASARVVVGDSCFAGKMPFYFSDRLPETLGRGGRLVFPAVEGLPADTPCRLFKPGSYASIREQIEAALAVTDEAELRREREAAVAWVKAGHTYRHRLQRAIDILRADGALAEAA